MNKKAKGTGNQNDVIPTPDIARDTEQIGKDVIIGTKTVDYVDDKNVISVIINAISVRINMPRGTVKVLMGCLAVLIIAALIYGFSVLDAHKEDKALEYQKSVNTVKAGITSGSREMSDYSLSREVFMPEKEVVISQNYSYVVPAGYFSEYPYLGGEWFVNAQAFSFYNGSGDWYLARSYITRADVGSKDFETIVLDRIKDANDVKNISYDYENFEIGKVLACKYEIFESGEPDVFAVEYSWEDDDGTVCSLEISSDAGDYEETARQVMASVHRAGNAMTNEELVARDKALYEEEYDEEYDEDMDDYDYDDPLASGFVDEDTLLQPDMEEIRRQQAMDAWNEYNKEEPDISDRVIKP